MESLQSHLIHTMSHWSSGLPRHEGPGFKPQGGYLRETGILLLALSRYIGDPDMIWSLASLPFRGCFTRLHADNVKSQQLHRPSVGASLGFTPTMCSNPRGVLMWNRDSTFIIVLLQVYITLMFLYMFANRIFFKTPKLLCEKRLIGWGIEKE